MIGGGGGEICICSGFDLGKGRKFPEYKGGKKTISLMQWKPYDFPGISLKICIVLSVVINKRSFESFMSLDLSQLPLLQYFSFVLCSVSAFLFMWGKPGCRLAMLAGSCTVWSMASSLMDKCLLTKPSAEETIPSTLSSARLVLGSMFPEPFSWIWNRLL